ncbi:hypothetical protein IFM89_032152 [Coptis chinensis]|uniref:Leucine-rich repeat-containing N-terminal plant-type domain-containing protein n=1 Tax=Coptis chinensis TaxID=261450 RepID=A0A835MBA3_9MAGN|nr:hypothetical protein IFM89_032152 [Coptis chinensis]
MSKSEEEEARNALVKFYSQLSRSNGSIDPSIGWHMNSDPCIGKWEGVFCDSKNVSVKKIVLDGFSLSGGLDAASLCKPESLAVMNLLENNFMGRYLARDWEFGRVPDLKGCFGLDSISGNAELCGEPLSNACPPSPLKKKLPLIVGRVL